MPSRPANGLSLTENVISSVGSETFTNSSGVGSSGEVMVSPIVMSEAPEKQTMSPIIASVTGLRVRPSIVKRETILVFFGGASGVW